jgi:glycosyltransferase involved in cell wall biosynthesis
VSARTLIVVPTHDEADNIVRLLDQLDAHAPEADVLVIDDASTDATRPLVRERLSAGSDHLRLIERPDKRGLGDAYREAFRVGIADGYDLLVQIDADLSHDPAALPLMLAVAEQGIPVVIGSRYIPGGTVTGWPRRRTWLSRWANRYVAVMLGLAVNDATAGYRVYRTEALEVIGLDDLEASGYGYQVEMTYRAVRAGLAVVEIPIAFRDRVAGRSKMDRRVVVEAFRLVTAWGVHDLVSLRRRRRAYRTPDTPTDTR